MSSPGQVDTTPPLAPASGRPTARTQLGAVLGGFYGLLGPLLFRHACINCLQIFGLQIFGDGLFRRGAPAWSIVEFVMFLPAILPAGMALYLSESTVVPLGQRGAEIAVLYLGTVLFWAGLGHLVHRALRAWRRQQPLKEWCRFRSSLLFLVGVSLLVLTAVVTAPLNKQAATRIALEKERRGQQLERASIVHEILNDTISVSVGEDERLTISRVRNERGWMNPFLGSGFCVTFEGRQNRLIGSRIVEFEYDTRLESFTLRVEVEGSLFSLKQVFELEQEGRLQKGRYVLKTEEGDELVLDVLDEVRYKEGSHTSGLGSFIPHLDIHLFD